MTAPKFSIVTPTILRVTADRTMESVDGQTSGDYEHIVMVDGVDGELPERWTKNPRRVFARCPVRHNDCGATCRNVAVTFHARAEYILYLDDDDYYTDNAIEILSLLVGGEHDNFGVFPIRMGGNRWLRLPPGQCRTATCQIYHRRVIHGQVIAFPPNQKHYEEDSAWAGQLAESFGYRVLDCHDLAVVDGGHNSSNLPGGPPMVELPTLVS